MLWWHIVMGCLHVFRVCVAGAYVSCVSQVVVWDTNRDEPLIASSKIDDYFHRWRQCISTPLLWGGG
jgi:hypothetical protein